MRELAIVVQNKNEGVTPLETINSINKNNFKNVFIQWYNKNWEYSQLKQLEHARKLGLNVIFAHLGYNNINSIWLEGEEGDLAAEQYKKDIEICKNHNIDLVIMHLCSKKNPPLYNELGLRRIKEIVKVAKELGVKIAFENTRTQGYLEYILEHIHEDNVGICFDIGHYHTHFKDKFNFENFKDKIFAIHLHDNDGTGQDQHLLPFDGNINWEATIKKIVESNYSGPITIESCYRYEYLNISIDEFYKEAYKRAEKIAKIFEKYDGMKNKK